MLRVVHEKLVGEIQTLKAKIKDKTGRKVGEKALKGDKDRLQSLEKKAEAVKADRGVNYLQRKLQISLDSVSRRIELQIKAKQDEAAAQAEKKNVPK